VVGKPGLTGISQEQIMTYIEELIETWCSLARLFKQFVMGAPPDFSPVKNPIKTNKVKKQ
jgi:hypothetical protein